MTTAAAASPLASDDPRIRGRSRGPGGRLLPKHGERDSVEYRAWRTMIRRCTNPKDRAYPRYGGRGISVCARWLDSVENFIADMGRKPDPTLELDREDNDGDYEPGNCRWTTRKVNDRNRRSNRMITLNGETLSLAEWCERRHLPRDTVRKRLEAGWEPQLALSTPVIRRGPLPRELRP